MSTPLITIITVVLNDAKNIDSTILSVASQTYKKIEYIVIDGGSTDGTISIIKKYEKQISHFISEPDNGIYDGMNKGTNLARGEWILYLNSGDKLNGDSIIYDIFHKHYLQKNDIDVLYSDVVSDYSSIRRVRKAKNLSQFWRGLPFSHQANFVRTDLAKRNPFDTSLKICADYDLMYNLYSHNAKFYYHNFPIAIVDISTGLSKTIDLGFLYREYIAVCKRYSNFSQTIMAYLAITAEFFYALIRRKLICVKNIFRVL